MIQPEAWLRGAINGIDGYLLPAAHGLIQAGEDLARALEGLSLAQIWMKPGGAASVGFHVRHAGGALDRLFTYAREESLSEAQKAAVVAEKGSDDADAEALRAGLRAAIEAALAQLRATPRERLLDERKVGRAGLPSTVLGLLYHGSEHTLRHAGQAITTAKIVRG
jgi:hypothetical protein